MTYEEFLTNAAEYVDLNHVPSAVKTAAYNVYTENPDLPAGFIKHAYDVSLSHNAKLAFELIAANKVKTANMFLRMRPRSLKPKMKSLSGGVGGIKSEMGINGLMVGGMTAMGATEKKTPYLQGRMQNIRPIEESIQG